MITIPKASELMAYLDHKVRVGNVSTYDIMLLKKMRRKNRQYERILRLNFLAQLYVKYQRLYLNTSILKNSDNSYESGEKTVNLIKMFFKDSDVKPEDFIHNPDTYSDDIIKMSTEYKNFLLISTHIGIPRRTAEAFVKEVEHGYTFYMLKDIITCPIPVYLDNLDRYILGLMSREELEVRFICPSLFSQKIKRAKLSVFRRGLIQMEGLFERLLKKQIERTGKPLTELLKETELTPEQLKKIPF